MQMLLALQTARARTHPASVFALRRLALPALTLAIANIRPVHRVAREDSHFISPKLEHGDVSEEGGCRAQISDTNSLLAICF